MKNFVSSIVIWFDLMRIPHNHAEFVYREDQLTVITEWLRQEFFQRLDEDI
jgi:hypothetical protein